MGRDRIPERKRPRFTGRGKGHPFSSFPNYRLQSEEYGALSGNAAKLLTQIASTYNGKNNGDLSIGWKDYSTRFKWVSKATLEKARKELDEAGFILLTKHGFQRRPHLYALTWHGIDSCPGKDLEVPPGPPRNCWRKTVPAPQNLNSHAPFSGAQDAA